MPKINQEEYEILKSLDGRRRWIARDRGGDLYAFLEKPEKHEEVWLSFGMHLLADKLDLDFIKWEDEEPYNIQELIDEYLDDEYGYFNMKPSREFEESRKSLNSKLKRG